MLCARPRTADIDAAAGALEEVRRIVEQLRRSWPGVEIVQRAGGGFCRDEMLSWCEANAVGYVIGLPKNARLQRRLKRRMKAARAPCTTIRLAGLLKVGARMASGAVSVSP